MINEMFWPHGGLHQSGKLNINIPFHSTFKSGFSQLIKTSLRTKTSCLLCAGFFKCVNKFSRDLFLFIVKIYSFLSLFLLYLYFGTFYVMSIMPFFIFVQVVLSNNEIPPEKVIKLIHDMLRLVQNLTERSSSSTPSLANYCISSVLEGLVIGPHALPSTVLSSPSYYVGSAQLMTGTPALFLLEIMVSRPLLQYATSHAR